VRERPSLAALSQEVKRRFAEHQLPSPNYRTLARRVAAVDAPLAAKKRDGSKAARDKFGPVGVSSLRPERLMDVLQIDHTPVDVIIVDQDWRRGWVCVALIRIVDTDKRPSRKIPERCILRRCRPYHSRITKRASI
jgi:putative transposase